MSSRHGECSRKARRSLPPVVSSWQGERLNTFPVWNGRQRQVLYQWSRLQKILHVHTDGFLVIVSGVVGVGVQTDQPVGRYLVSDFNIEIVVRSGTCLAGVIRAGRSL